MHQPMEKQTDNQNTPPMRVPNLDLLEDCVHRAARLINSLKAECRGTEKKLRKTVLECERLRRENAHLGKSREEARKRIERMLDRLSFLEEMTKS